MTVSGFGMLQLVEASFCRAGPTFIHENLCSRSCDENGVEDIGRILGSSSFRHFVEMKKQYSWARDDCRSTKIGHQRWFGVDVESNLERSLQYIGMLLEGWVADRRE
jgi:hypothetical protein